jgi:RecA-family ATPase
VGSAFILKRLKAALKGRPTVMRRTPQARRREAGQGVAPVTDPNAKQYTLLSEVKPKQAKALWHPWIHLRACTLIDGDPGTNKSILALDIAARVSVGAKMPDGGEAVKGGVVLLVGEDSIRETVRPRLEAAGADLTRIAALPTSTTIPDDLPLVKEAAREVEAKLFVIDPLMAFLGVNAHVDQAVRKALTPLADFADATNVAVLMVRHLTKGGGRHALYRGSGSIGISAAARSAILVAHALHDAGLRVLCHVKNSLGLKAPCLLFEPVTKDGVVGIKWRGACEYKAEDLLKNADGKADRLEEAKDFLLDLLAKGAVKQQTVEVKAKEAGLAWRTVERAKEGLGVESSRKGWGPGSECYWNLPKQDQSGGEGEG